MILSAEDRGLVFEGFYSGEKDGVGAVFLHKCWRPLVCRQWCPANFQVLAGGLEASPGRYNCRTWHTMIRRLSLAHLKPTEVKIRAGKFIVRPRAQENISLQVDFWGSCQFFVVEYY